MTTSGENVRVRGWLRSGAGYLPIVGQLLRLGYRKSRRGRSARTFRTEDYWEARYANGGRCGCGSYGRLAQFKADVVNTVVREHAIHSVIELGSGDGAQLALADYPRYTGVDVSRSAIARCRAAFKDDATKQFFHTSERDHYESRYDLALSLDVIFHLIEEPLFNQYMKDLFQSAERLVIIYSTNFDEFRSAHVRHRHFSPWVETYAPGWRLLQHIRNRYPFDAEDRQNTAEAEFYIYQRVDTCTHPPERTS